MGITYRGECAKCHRTSELNQEDGVCPNPECLAWWNYGRKETVMESGKAQQIFQFSDPEKQVKHSYVQCFGMGAQKLCDLGHYQPEEITSFNEITCLDCLRGHCREFRNSLASIAQALTDANKQLQTQTEAQANETIVAQLESARKCRRQTNELKDKLLTEVVALRKENAEMEDHIKSMAKEQLDFVDGCTIRMDKRMAVVQEENLRLRTAHDNLVKRIAELEASIQSKRGREFL